MSSKRIFYHKNCADGMTGAWVVRQAMKAKGENYPWFFQALLYGDEISLDGVKDAEVIYVDFSPTVNVLDQILEVAKSVLILDHHKTAIKDLEPAFKGLCLDDGEKVSCSKCENYSKKLTMVLDTERSGAMIAWDHFFASNELTPHLRKAMVPNLVRYVQDRDLWKFELPHSKQIQCYIRSYKMNLEEWDKLAQQLGYAGDNGDVNIELAATMGSAMLRSQDCAVETMADNHVWVKLLEHTIPIANATIYFSDVGHELNKRFPYTPFAGYYLDRSDGKRQWGLTSSRGFDVSVVAKTFGGGGHAGAAGFTTSQTWFPEKAKDFVIPD